MYYFIISARFPFYWISHYIHYYTIGQDADFVQYFNSQNQMSSTQLLNSLLIFCNSQFIIKYTVTYLYIVWNQFTSNKSNAKRSKLLKKYDRKDITLSLCYKIQKKIYGQNKLDFVIYIIDFQVFLGRQRFFSLKSVTGKCTYAIFNTFRWIVTRDIGTK